MTRKNYNKIASLFKEALDADVDNTREGLLVSIDFLSRYLKEDNSLFDEERFKAACGLVECR